MIAAIRPDDWNVPLFLHVLGAMILVGALVLVVTSLVLGWRADGAVAARTTRLGFLSLLLAALPAWLVMRLAAQWVASEEGVANSDAAWIGIGYVTADFGLLLLVVATIVAGLGARLRRRGRGRALAAVAAVLASLLLLANIAAVWAMTAKP